MAVKSTPFRSTSTGSPVTCIFVTSFIGGNNRDIDLIGIVGSPAFFPIAMHPGISIKAYSESLTSVVRISGSLNKNE